MKKQINLFGSSKDEQEIVDFLLDEKAKLEKKSSLQWLFWFDDAFVQLLRCEANFEAAVIGRIAIQTTEELVGSRHAESAFRKLDRHIKKNFSNHLRVRNENVKGSERDIRTVWVGSSLQELVTSNPDLLMKQGFKSPLVYILSEAKN
ncbi:hypothetical protein AAFN60_09510 [Roseibacillus persicicus]|uniref:hypothetical protein n=1 Tax=Roseibacillus persicicus TaxID=454148 RepID=UPI00398A6B35